MITSNNSNNIFIAGMGRIGEATLKLLLQWHQTENNHLNQIFCFDKPEVLEIFAKNNPELLNNHMIKLLPFDLNIATQKAIKASSNKNLIVINSLPCTFSSSLAALLQDKDSQISYFDYTEDLATARQIEEISKQKISRFVPQCGLAPGFSAILGNYLIESLSHQDNLKLLVSVGALSDLNSADNDYRYAWSWSPEGVINEYFKKSEVIKNSQYLTVSSLDGLSNYHLKINDQPYQLEGFYTSGGLGRLPEKIVENFDNINSVEYKSLRYPGHQKMMKIATFLNDHPGNLTEKLKKAIPLAQEDQVFIMASAENSSGEKKEYINLIKPENNLSAIQLTTASGLLALVEMEIKERLPSGFFIRPEDISWEDFSNTYFAKPYLDYNLDNVYHEVTDSKINKIKL